jgi:hypothetical protein
MATIPKKEAMSCPFYRGENKFTQQRRTHGKIQTQVSPDSKNHYPDALA